MNHYLSKIFLNETNNKLRNGWWILIFIGFVALTRPIYGPIRSTLREWGVAELWLEPTSFLLILLATWACTLLRRESITSVGLAINGRWFKQFSIGFAISLVQMILIVAAILMIGGVEFTLNPERSVTILLTGLYTFLLVALMEELLHRGFIFQRLIDGIGIWGAQLIIAILFAAGHWGNPGMEGTTQFWASLDIGLGAILWGLAYYKTRSLAMPVGMHLSWNWIQGNVLGFGVSGMESQGWLTPVLQDKAQWLTGGAFGPEASVFAVIVDVLFIVILWRMKRWNPLKTNKSASADATLPLTS